VTVSLLDAFWPRVLFASVEQHSKQQQWNKPSLQSSESSKLHKFLSLSHRTAKLLKTNRADLFELRKLRREGEIPRPGRRKWSETSRWNWRRNASSHIDLRHSVHTQQVTPPVQSASRNNSVRSSHSNQTTVQYSLLKDRSFDSARVDFNLRDARWLLTGCCINAVRLYDAGLRGRGWLADGSVPRPQLGRPQRTIDCFSACQCISLCTAPKRLRHTSVDGLWL